MKLAELKRRLTPGTVIYLRECLTGFVPAADATREVRENCSTFVSFNRLGSDLPSYLYWPAASQVIETTDGFATLEAGRISARYSWQAPRADEPMIKRPGDWTIGVPATEIRGAVTGARMRCNSELDVKHVEALMGDKFGWTINAENLAAFVAFANTL